MYLWLPLYLNDHLGYPPLTAGLLSTSFDIGGVFGGPILGCLSDSRGTTLSWVFKASLCVCFSLAIITMFNPKNVLILGMFVSDCYSRVFILKVYQVLTTIQLLSFHSFGLGLCLMLIGFGNCGSDSILTGPVSTNLGERSGRDLGAGVTALINGVSSIGGIIEGSFIHFSSSSCKFSYNMSWLKATLQSEF